jgi:hypothetical protein
MPPFTQQSGKVTPGHLAQWETTGVISDSGIPSSTQISPSTIFLLNASGSALKPGNAVYLSGSLAVSKAIANSYATAGVIGLASGASLSNTNVLLMSFGYLTLSTTALWDAVTGQSGGLTVGALYFLDPSTAGNITASFPTTPGQVNTLIGKALSSTKMFITLGDAVLL